MTSPQETAVAHDRWTYCVHDFQRQPPLQPQSSTQPLFYVLSLNSRFSGGADLRKGAPVTLSSSCPASHSLAIVSPEALGLRGQHVHATHLRSNNKSTFHFYMQHLKPSLHVKQSSHLGGGQAPGAKDAYPSLSFF